MVKELKYKVFLKSTWSWIWEYDSTYLVINKDIANESFELGNKTLHAEAKKKFYGLIIDNTKPYKIDYKSS